MPEQMKITNSLPCLSLLRSLYHSSSRWCSFVTTDVARLSLVLVFFVELLSIVIIDPKYLKTIFPFCVRSVLLVALCLLVLLTWTLLSSALMSGCKQTIKSFSCGHQNTYNFCWTQNPRQKDVLKIFRLNAFIMFIWPSCSLVWIVSKCF